MISLKTTKQIEAIASVALLVLLSGCEKEISTSFDHQGFTIKATVASTAETKTTLGDDLFVSWQVGDAIDIACSNTGSTIVEFTADNAGKTVPFSSSDDNLAGFTGGEKAQFTYYGMYPAFNTYEWDGAKFRTMIPKNQVIADGSTTSWDPLAVIAAGVCIGERMIMPFKNAHALVKVVLPQWDTDAFTPISVLLMGGSPDDVLAADYWVTPSENSLPALTRIDNANSVRTVAVTKSSFTPGETVYLAVTPGTVHGLSVYVSSPTRTSRISTAQNIDFEQNNIYVLDFSNTEIENFGDPVSADPHVPNQGEYIIVSSDGSVSYYQDLGNQSGHPDGWRSEIFEIINGVYTPVNTTNMTIRFVRKNNTPSYAVALCDGNGNSAFVGYLKYDMEWQASRLLRGEGSLKNIPSSATIYTIYNR